MTTKAGFLRETTGSRLLAMMLVPLGITAISLASKILQIPEEPAALLVLVAFSGLLGGLWIGLLAAALQLIHALWTLSSAAVAAGAAPLVPFSEGFGLALADPGTRTFLMYLVVAPAVAIAAALYRRALAKTWLATTAQEKFANKIFEQAGIAIAYSDVSGHILRCNQTYSDLVGRTPDEVVGMNFRDLVDPRDREENWTLSRQLLAGQTGTFTLVNRYLRKDGTSVWSRKIVTLIRSDAGEATNLLLFATDITDEIGLRVELEQSEANYRSLWESSGNPNFLVFEPDFRIEDANRAALRFLGATDQQQLKTFRLADVSPELQEDDEASGDKERRLLATALREETATSEWHFRSLDGREAYATINFVRIEAGGRVGLLCSAVDITDRVLLSRHQADARRLLAEEVNNRTAELEEVTYELHLAQSVGGMGSFSVDLVSGTFSCSPETARILNLNEFDKIETSKWTEKVHPDDLQAVLSAWERAVGGGAFDVTYRIVIPEGVRHVKAGARFKRDSDGKPIFAIGALLDLTSLLANREKNVLRAYRGRVDGLLAATAAVQADAEQNISTDPRRLADDLHQQFPDWSAAEIEAVIEQAIATIKGPKQ